MVGFCDFCLAHRYLYRRFNQKDIVDGETILIARGPRSVCLECRDHFPTMHEAARANKKFVVQHCSRREK